MERRVVIMAGGGGERFWPASRPGRPKQLIPIERGRTLLEAAVARLSPLLDPNRVTIVLGADIAEAAREALAHLPGVEFLVEPARRNTCACLAYAHAHLTARYGEHLCAVLTADHLIRPEEDFRKCVEAAFQAAETRGRIVLMGIQATRPETGYGYIEAQATPAADGAPREVVRFVEKPPLERAIEFVASGHHLWNSGMFFWRSDIFEAALRRHSPEHARLLGASAGDLAHVFASLPSVPIDKAVLEKLDDLLVLDAAFQWEDVGSWTALGRLHEPDDAGNVIVGGATLRDTRDSIVYVEPAPGAAPPRVALLGVEGLVVAVSGDRILVMHRDRAQDVREISRLMER